jgi:hypothetical protein
MGKRAFFMVTPAAIAGALPWSITRYTGLVKSPFAVLGPVVTL